MGIFNSTCESRDAASPDAESADQGSTGADVRSAKRRAKAAEQRVRRLLDADRARFRREWAAYESASLNPTTRTWPSLTTPGTEKEGEKRGGGTSPLSYGRYGKTVTELVLDHFHPRGKSIRGLADLQLIRTLGEGSFGRVILAQEAVAQGKHGKKQNPSSATPNFYAVKVQNKARIVRFKQVRSVLTEKKILWCVKGFPIVVSMEASFRDNSNLYMVLEFVAGGELFTELRKRKKFPEPQAAFYGAQVCLALDYLHGVNVLYRDLKPENILIHAPTGYLKMADFGFSKMTATRDARTYTFCGTPDYMAPEVVASRGYGAAADWWALGVLLYEMTAGYAPFSKMADDDGPGNDRTAAMFRDVCAGRYTFPLNPEFSPALRDLIGNLVRVETVRRFGTLHRGTSDISGHAWFLEMGLNDWSALYARKICAPFIPHTKGAGDVATYFGKGAKETPIEVAAFDEFPELFGDF